MDGCRFDSVAYHEATVAQPGDDFAGRAMAYCGSRGETPLAWGGSGADTAGPCRFRHAHAYRAIYGPGGAIDPVTGDRLVTALRPGMELVVSAHNSVAVLGVIGRADDMHRILDAERDATLGHLERLTIGRGGRRGREATPTARAGSPTR